MKVIAEDQSGPEFLPLPAGTSYSEATDVTPTPGNDTVYTANIRRDWCIGIGMFYLASHLELTQLLTTKFPMADISCL
jgi:hypothetical protein